MRLPCSTVVAGSSRREAGVEIEEKSFFQVIEDQGSPLDWLVFSVWVAGRALLKWLQSSYYIPASAGGNGRASLLRV
jgi:hypothetical protein